MHEPRPFITEQTLLVAVRGDGVRDLRPQLLHHVLALEVPDLDGGAAACGAEQVPRQRSGQGKAGCEWTHPLGKLNRKLSCGKIY